ncbi:MAG: hypothetical protein GY926_01070 [bacterium]|nr:hypothetical protein [bacterium]
MPISPSESTTSRLRAFCQLLIGRASDEVERAYGTSFDARIVDTIDLVDHNEAVVGLENLLANLGEFEINLLAGERDELEQIIVGLRVDRDCPLRYQVIFWDHDLSDEPTLMYGEIGVDGFEVRKVEEYQTGRQDFAGLGLQRGTAQLSKAPVPPVPEIVVDPQFSGHSLTRAEFEAVWTQATTGGLQVGDLDSAIEVFIDWAGGPTAVRLLYTPAVLLAVDTKDRRGFLLDEVYLATLWADRGRSELQAALAESLAAAGKDPPVSSGFEPNPHDLIHGAMRHGQPIV